MIQSPAKTYGHGRPWLHWPPTRGEWLDAAVMLGVMMLFTVFFITCAAHGTNPGAVLGAIFWGGFLFVAIGGIVAFIFSAIAALLP